MLFKKVRTYNMVSIYLKIQIALLHSIDFIVRYKQENISQYVIEVLRIDEFSSILNYLTWRLIFLVKGGRRLKKKKKKKYTDTARFQTSLPTWPRPWSFTKDLKGGGKRDRNIISWAITEETMRLSTFLAVCCCFYPFSKCDLFIHLSINTRWHPVMSTAGI